MFDETSGNRLATDEELLDYVRNAGIETVLDIRTKIAEQNTFEFSFVPSRWDEYDDFLGLSKNRWKECKYYDELSHVSQEVRNIPCDKGGIYMYVVKPPIDIPYMPVIMYIGRARNNGEKQNLRKRVNSYFYEAQNIYNGRNSIRKLFKQYAPYLYVVYLPLDRNEDIDKLEKELIVAVIPPFNKDLVQKSLREGREAF